MNRTLGALTPRQRRAIAAMHREQIFGACLEFAATGDLETLAIAICIAAEITRFETTNPN